MKDLDKFVLYDPVETNGTSSIPDRKGCYLIVLRSNATFIECKKIAIAPKLPSIDVSGTSYSVVYVGETKSLRDEYENNFNLCFRFNSMWCFILSANSNIIKLST